MFIVYGFVFLFMLHSEVAVAVAFNVKSKHCEH